MSKKVRSIDYKGVLDIAAYFDERSKLTLVKNYYEVVEEKAWNTLYDDKTSLCRLEKLIAIISRTTGEILATISQEYQEKDCTHISDAIKYLVEETFGCIIETEENRLSFQNINNKRVGNHLLFFRLEDFFRDGKINPFLPGKGKKQDQFYYQVTSPDSFADLVDDYKNMYRSSSTIISDDGAYIAFARGVRSTEYYPIAYMLDLPKIVSYVPYIFNAKWGDDDSTNVIGSIESGNENINYFLRTANKRYLVPSESCLNWLHFSEVMKHYKS